MAEALMQYQACLGIMVQLQVDDLTLLQDDFQRAGQGLSLRDFVNVMLDRVRWEPEKVVKFIEDLVELFAQVDVNGDGTMEWEEFMSAIIEGGMGSPSGDNDDVAGIIAQLSDLQYEEHPRFIDTAVNRPLKRIEYFPEFRRVLLLENSRPVVELLDPTGLLPPETNESAKDGRNGFASSEEDANMDPYVGDDALTTVRSFNPTLPVVNKFHPLCYISGYRRDQDEVRSERSPVQAIKYLAGLDLLAVSAGDLKLTFWSSALLTACSTSAMETLRPLAIVHTPRPQRVLEWDPKTQHLFSISADLLILVWQVMRSPIVRGKPGTSKSRQEPSDGTCDVRLVATLKKHTDLLQDLLVLNNDTLLSCGMDNMIYLWDTNTLLTRAFRQGHRRGVRLLVKLSSQVFMSAGFECEVFGWEASALATVPAFRLSGHTSPVCSIQLVPSAAFTAASARPNGIKSSIEMSADQCITLDDEGWFRWWTLTNILSVESANTELSSNRRCLQVFRLGSGLSRSPRQAHSFVVLNNGQNLLVTGTHKVKLLRRVQVKPRVLASSAVLYNEASLTIATATDREIRIWDAASGTLLRSYRNLVSADITCVNLDSRQRKLIVGAQNGELVVANYLNGAVLARWVPHRLQVSAILYCQEDHTVLTASWDRSLRLYDDNAPRVGDIAAQSVLLRSVTDAHESDIKCIAYCYALSLVASGGTDGIIKIWDYIYFLLEDTCSPPPATSRTTINEAAPLHETSDSQVTSEVNVLEFIEPYPLLLSGHESGQICIWSLTSFKSAILLLCFYPFHMTPRRPLTSVESSSSLYRSGADAILKPQKSNVFISLESLQTDRASSGSNTRTSTPGTPPPPLSPLTLAKLNSAVTCCQTFYDETGGEQLAADIDRGRFLLFASSFNGEVSVCDISKVIAKAQVKAFCEENMPSRHDRSYNPRRHFFRQGKNAKRLRNKHGDSLSGGHSTSQQLFTHDSHVICTHRWTAHRGNLRCLQVVAEPRGVLTCGSDKGVYIWDFQGRRMGSLTTTFIAQSVAGKHGDLAASAFDCNSVWRWEVDVASAATSKRQQAEQLWEELKDSKLKMMALRQQSAGTRDRKRRPVYSSASVPNLDQSLRNQSARNLAGSVSTSALELREDNNAAESMPHIEHREENNAVASQTLRVFDQLQGNTTWKKSPLQLARQAVWEKERLRFQQRMKMVMRQKNIKKDVEERAMGVGNQHGDANLSLGDVNDSLGKLEGLEAGRDLADMVLPSLQRSLHELPFADKDNWTIGSLNREKEMYSHFHRESTRRNSKKLAESSGLLRQRRVANSLVSMDLAPSTFLLEKLGGSCIIRENVLQQDAPRRRRATKKPPRPKRIAALSKTRSLTALPEKESNESALASSASTSALPRRNHLSTCCREDDVLSTDDREENSSNDKSSSSLPVFLSSSQSINADALESFDEQNLAVPASLALITNGQSSPTSLRRLHLKSVLTSTERSPRLHRATPLSKSTGTIRTTAMTQPSKQSAKKVRIRSDAELLQQERFGPYSRDNIINFYHTFRQLDQDQSGSITLHEIFESPGFFSGTHMHDNLSSIFSSIDKDQSGVIDLAEFCRVVFKDASSEVLNEIQRLCKLLDLVKRNQSVQKKTLSNDQVRELEQLFKLYDTDGNDDIDAAELLQGLVYNERFYESNIRHRSAQLTKEDVVRIISTFDVDANATLNLKEFIELFRNEV